ncbi:MAG: hypothetical protein AAGD17_14385 [Bacteroidota bacterium]
MKLNLFLVLMAFCLGFSVNAQKNSGFNSEQALVNGCSDGTNAQGKQPFGNSYQSIMNNPSISSAYKDAYNEAYSRCFSGGKYYWKKGELVYKAPKNSKDKTVKPGIYGFKTYLGGLKK